MMMMIIVVVEVMGTAVKIPQDSYCEYIEYIKDILQVNNK